MKTDEVNYCRTDSDSCQSKIVGSRRLSGFALHCSVITYNVARSPRVPFPIPQIPWLHRICKMKPQLPLFLLDLTISTSFMYAVIQPNSTTVISSTAPQVSHLFPCVLLFFSLTGLSHYCHRPKPSPEFKSQLKYQLLLNSL